MAQVDDGRDARTFEEAVAGWADSLSFAPASRFVKDPEQDPWALGDKDISNLLAQKLAMRWDEEIANATEKSISTASTSGIRSNTGAEDSQEDPINYGMEDDAEKKLMGAQEDDFARSNKSGMNGASSLHDATLSSCPSLWRIMWWSLGREYAVGGMLTLLQIACVFLPLAVLPVLMSYLQHGATHVSEIKALVISGTIGISFMAHAFFRSQAAFQTGRLVLQFGSALRGLVFAKSLRLKFKAWDSRIPTLGDTQRDAEGRKIEEKSTSQVAHSILTSVPLVEHYLTHFHSLWTTPIALCVCIAYLWYFMQLSSLAGLVVFAATFSFIHGALSVKMAQDEQDHAQTVLSRNLQLTDILSSFTAMKEMCYERFFEARLKNTELTAPRASLYIWSLSFALSNTSFIFAALCTLFFRAVVVGVSITVTDLLIVQLLFLFMQVYFKPYIPFLVHCLRMTEFMDTTRMLLLEEEVESFDNANIILACARYAVITKSFKLAVEVPRMPNASRAPSVELHRGEYGGFYEPQTESLESPSPAMVVRHMRENSNNANTAGTFSDSIIVPSSSSSSLNRSSSSLNRSGASGSAMSSTSLSSNSLSISSPFSTPRKKPRAYAPSADVIRVPDQNHIVLEHATFIWDDHSISRQLRDLSVRIKQGQFVAVLGSTASGKSSLLKALIGEMSLVSGAARVSGTVSYAPQNPWTLTETICFNITFTYNPPNREHYLHVLDASGVTSDLEDLEDGDSTILSEAGFSAPQIARISLARALYRQAEIYLFDDLFSAFETEKMAQEALERTLASVSAATRVVALSHHIPLLDKADLIIYLKDGEIVHSGAPHELRELNSPDFFDALALETKARNMIGKPKNQVSLAKANVFNAAPLPLNAQRAQILDPNEVLAETIGIPKYRLAGPGCESNASKVRIAVQYYAKRIGMSIAVVLGLALVTCMALDIASLLRFAYWLQSNNTPQELQKNLAPNQIRLNQFAAVVVWSILNVISVALFILSFWCFCSGAKSAALKIWFAIVDTVLKWPVSAMLRRRRGAGKKKSKNRNRSSSSGSPELASSSSASSPPSSPSSRPSNAVSATFSGGTVGTSHLAQLLIFETFRFQGLLPRQWHECLALLFLIASCVVTAAVGSPFSIPFVFGTLYFLVKIPSKLFPSTSRLSQLVTSSNCLLESCYASVLQGAVTVRAYEAEHRFTNAFFARQDETNRAKLSQHLLASYAQLRLGLFASIIPCAVCVFAVLCKMAFGYITAANFGVAYFWALYLAILFAHIPSQFSSLLTLVYALFNLRAVLNHSPREDEWESERNDPRHSWPTQASIEFAHVTVAKKGLHAELRDEEGDIVRSKCSLWDVSFKIEGKKTVAFVGPRGSGKSSIIRCLMRFDEPDKNGASLLGLEQVKILIDDVNIAKLGLHTLRSKIAVISPFVLNLTMREYLGEEVVEANAWRALEQVGLQEKVSFMDAKLDSMLVYPDGTHALDATERILFSMARALLYKMPIVVFKEPRLPIDSKLVHEVLMESFANKVTLIIVSRSQLFAQGANTTFNLHQGSFAQSLL